MEQPAWQVPQSASATLAAVWLVAPSESLWLRCSWAWCPAWDASDPHLCWQNAPIAAQENCKGINTSKKTTSHERMAGL
jgi:hypothetical protein